jgi:hypothetical protein
MCRAGHPAPTGVEMATARYWAKPVVDGDLVTDRHAAVADKKHRIYLARAVDVLGAAARACRVPSIALYGANHTGD